MSTDQKIGMVFSGGTALAGLILVFLGGVSAAYESYEPTQKKSVQNKYHLRARIAFLGLFLSLTSAVFAISSTWALQTILLYGGSILLMLSFIFVVVLAIITVKDI